MTSLIVGQVLTVEPEFTVGHIILAARGYDYAHALHRSPDDRDLPERDRRRHRARRSPPRAGLQAGEIDAAAACTTSCSRATRPTGTSSGASRSRVDCEVVVDKRTLHFRKAGARGQQGRR